MVVAELAAAGSGDSLLAIRPREGSISLFVLTHSRFGRGHATPPTSSIHQSRSQAPFFRSRMRGGTKGANLSSLINDADPDPTNELNRFLWLDGTELHITDAGGTKSASLATLAERATPIHPATENGFHSLRQLRQRDRDGRCYREHLAARHELLRCPGLHGGACRSRDPGGRGQCGLTDGSRPRATGEFPTAAEWEQVLDSSCPTFPKLVGRDNDCYTDTPWALGGFGGWHLLDRYDDPWAHLERSRDHEHEHRRPVDSHQAYAPSSLVRPWWSITGLVAQPSACHFTLPFSFPTLS